MKSKFLTAVCLCICFFFSSGNGQNIINIGIGPTWPKDLRGTEKPTAWNATIEYFKLFDNIVGFGLDLDFSWNVLYNDSTIYSPTDTVTRRLNENKMFMFPISAALLFDPIPKFVFHPVIKGQVGLNMMVRYIEELDSAGEVEKSNKNGFYIGMIGKASADLVYDIGEHVALFAGFEAQWGKVRKKKKDSVTGQDYYYYKCHAPGIRMGLSVLY